MSLRILCGVVLVIGLLSGCASNYLTRELLCNEDSSGSAESRAAKCMVAAGIETAKKKSGESQSQDTASEDTKSGPPPIR